MMENEVVDLKLSERLLNLMLDEKIPFEKKKGKMDYLIRIGADVNQKVYGKSLALWVKELGDEEAIKYVKENGGIEQEISKEKRDELRAQFWDKGGRLKSFRDIKNLVLQGANLGGINNNDEQIWKYLSIEEINKIVRNLPKGYRIVGDVNLRNKGLTNLPDFSKIIIHGSFDCGNNKLTDLTGAPREVGWDFDCSKNLLTDLKEAPIKVGGTFSCWENKLKDLTGAPFEVGIDFWCHDNQLETLNGAPREVNGWFDCRKNQLVSLKGAPGKVWGDFDCFGNQLESLEGKPEYIGGKFGIEDEVLKKFEEKENDKKDASVFKRIFGRKVER